MSDRNAKLNGVQHNEANGCQRIEPDWTKSEWFRVWLQLARQPYQFEEPNLTSEAELLTLDLSPSNSADPGSVEKLTAQG